MQTYRKSVQSKDLRENGKIILAHGEVTGHSHQIVSSLDTQENPDLDKYQYFEEPRGVEGFVPGRRILMVLEPCVLRHQEHDPIHLDPKNPAMARQGDVLLIPIGSGTWEVRRQNEYTPTRIIRVCD